MRAIGASRDARCGFARRRAAAASIIADAVLRVVGEVGVPGPILVFDVAVVLRALVGVLNFERDRRAGRHLLARSVGKDPGEDCHRIGFLALGREAGLAGLALVEIALDVALIEGDAGRTTVDDGADRGPVAFAPGRHAEKMAEGVVRHRLADRLRGRPVEISLGGAATIVLPGCVTTLLRCGGKRRQARSAGKARDKLRRRRLTQPQSAYVDGSVSLSSRYDDSTRNLYPYLTGNSAEHAIAARTQPASHRRIACTGTRAELVLSRKD